MGTEGSRFATACRTTFDVCRVDQHCWDEFSYRFCWPSELVAPPSEVGRVWACEDIEIDG